MKLGTRNKKSPLRHTTNTMHAEPHVVKFYTKDKKEITDVDAIKELTSKWGGGDMGQLDYNGQKVKFSTIKSESVSKEELEDPNLLKDKEEKSYLDNFDVFKSTKEGNEFRAFVNQFDPEWAQTEVDYKSGKTTQLSLKGNRKNKFIASAYKVYGEEYERFKSLPPEAQHQIYGFGDEKVDINKIIEETK